MVQLLHEVDFSIDVLERCDIGHSLPARAFGSTCKPFLLQKGYLDEDLNSLQSGTVRFISDLHSRVSEPWLRHSALVSLSRRPPFRVH